MQSQHSVATVSAVCSSGTHSMAKEAQPVISLLTGIGVEGDAHSGAKIQHLFRVARNPDEPNLRQVHLIHAELHDELAANGFSLGPGEMGENLTTRGIDLLALSTGTRLHLGESAVIEVTGLRNPCHQLDGVQPGLKAATLDWDEAGNLRRKAGVMAIVLADGAVRPGDAIRVVPPTGDHRPLQPV